MTQRRPVSSRVPPHNLDAEEALLGAMMLDIDAAKVGLAELEPGDFYQPHNALIFDVMRRLRADGELIEAVSVSDVLRKDGTLDEVGGMQALLEIRTHVPAISNAESYARMVASTSKSRSLIALSAEMAEMAYAEIDPDEVIDRIQGRLAQTTLRSARQADAIQELTTFQQFVEEYADKPRDSIVDGIISRHQRLMWIGVEGGAKSTLMRQIAIATAGGRHPFTQRPMTKRTTLYFEFETPDEAVAHQAALTLRGGRHVLDKLNDAWLYHQQGGMNLLSPKDQAIFERCVQFVKPELILIGPIYRSFKRKAGVREEDVLPELFDFLDDILVRYGCALMMEHHAPLGTGGIRELRSFGSSLWGRWPDMAWALYPAETDREGRPLVINVQTAGRGNRMNAPAMPDRLVRGGDSNFPWLASTRPR